MWLAKSTDRTGARIGPGLAAAVAAAGAVYFLDPRSGGRRRALILDQANRIARQGREFVAKAGTDARQRAQGLYKESVSRFGFRPADDVILEERIRAELGRLSSHPGAIEVSSSDGTVQLRGDALEEEVSRILSGVNSVRGVQNVVNELRVHQDAASIPSLQGGRDERPARFEYLQENWSPAPRLLAGATGFALMLGGLGRRSAAGLGLAAVGAALLGRSISNTPWSQLLGINATAEDGVLVQKTIHVYADVDEAYSCWRNLENFPRFMSHVREVTKLGDTRYHWQVAGPAGVPIEWDAMITAEVAGELIAWRTTEGSAVQSSGVVQFEPTRYGGTRIHMRMSYRPPANIVGHTVAKIFGRDPKRQIDADLARFKTYIETGRTPRHSAAESATRH